MGAKRHTDHPVVTRWACTAQPFNIGRVSVCVCAVIDCVLSIPFVCVLHNNNNNNKPTGDYPHGDVAELGGGHVDLPAAEMGNLEELSKVWCDFCDVKSRGHC